jgi:hypothetical protein
LAEQRQLAGKKPQTSILSTYASYLGELVECGLIVAGLGMLALGLPIPIVGIALAAIINGAALEVFSLIWTNTLQELVPGERLGRVASIDMLGSFALLPAGYALTG